MSLQNTPPPRLPDVEKDVDKGYVTGLLRALRLYFNGLFTLMGGVLSWLETLQVEVDTLQTDVTALQHTVFQAGYYRNDGALVAHGTQGEVTSWSAASFNTSLGSWDTTNGRITPNRAGYYQAKFSFNFGSSAINFLMASLYKNGGAQHADLRGTAGTDMAYAHAIASGLIYCNGTTDYISCFVRQQNSTVSSKALYDASGQLEVFLVRPG